MEGNGRRTVYAQDIANVELVLADAEKVEGEFAVQLAGVLALVRGEEVAGGLDEADGGGEDGHDHAAVLDGAGECALADGVEFLGVLAGSRLRVRISGGW